MHKTTTSALEIAATALLPGTAFGLLAFTAREVLGTFPSPFLAAEVLPWLLLSLAVPIGLLIALAAAQVIHGVRRGRERDLITSDLFGGR